MSDRRLETVRFESNKPALLHWTKFRNSFRVTWNIIILTLCQYLPLKIKNRVLRALGIDVDRNAAIALGVMFDIFHPEKISIGRNTTIGYGTTVLAHETTRDEFRIGPVEIGENVLIGANSTILPGVNIGDGAKVAAGSVVTHDVEKDEFVGGVPAEKID